MLPSVATNLEQVVTADGSRIPIPVKRYKEIREELAALYDLPAADE